MSADGIEELDIQFAILNLMKDRRIWSNADLKGRLAKTLPLSAHDRERAPKRTREARWENRVNNALSPSRGSSLYAKGHVENVSRGHHRITDLGYAFITGTLTDDLVASLGL